MRLPAPVLLLLIVAAFCVLVGLGVWQVQRNEWKQDLVARSDERTDAAPMLVTSVEGGEAADAEAMDFRRVILEGEWAAGDVMFVTNRIRHSTRGEEIVAPLRPAGGGPAVLVNLGWIPLGARDDVVPGLLDAPAVVEGLARDPGERSARTIPDGAWTGLSPASMGEALGYPVADWFVFAGPEREGQGALGDALPIQGWQRFTNTTPHIEYALTWFGLALALVAVAVVRLMVEPRRRARDSTPATGAEDDGGGDG